MFQSNKLKYGLLNNSLQCTDWNFGLNMNVATTSHSHPYYHLATIATGGHTHHTRSDVTSNLECLEEVFVLAYLCHRFHFSPTATNGQELIGVCVFFMLSCRWIGHTSEEGVGEKKWSLPHGHTSASPEPIISVSTDTDQGGALLVATVKP